MEQTETSFEQFQLKCFELVQPLLKLEKLGKVPLNREEQRTFDLFMLLASIDQIRSDMQSSIAYIEVGSRRPVSIPYELHMRYHHDVFLQNVYNLQEKLKLVWPTIHKVGGRWLEKARHKESHSVISNALSKHLKDITELRRAIVHDARPYTLPKLIEAKMYCLVQSLQQDPEGLHEYKAVKKDLKSEILRMLRTCLASANAAVESLFSYLMKQYVTDGRLTLPK